MKLWNQLSAREKLKRTEWATGLAILLSIILGTLDRWVWYLLIPVAAILYVGAQLHIRNQIELEKRDRDASSSLH